MHTYLTGKQWSQPLSSIISYEREKSLYEKARASKTPFENCIQEMQIQEPHSRNDPINFLSKTFMKYSGNAFDTEGRI